MPKFLVKAKLQKMFVVDAPDEQDAKIQVQESELENFIVIECTEMNAATADPDAPDETEGFFGGPMQMVPIIKYEHGSDQ